MSDGVTDAMSNQQIAEFVDQVPHIVRNYTHMHLHICMYIYIYIYIERERDVCITYIYIYIYYIDEGSDHEVI